MSDNIENPLADESWIDLSSRDAQRYPHLSVDMAKRIGIYGTEEVVPAGTFVFRRGDRCVDFFFVLEGAIQIVDQGQNGDPVVIATHSQRQFSGELDQLSHRQILVSGLTMLETRLIRVNRENLSRLIATETDIGEIVMRAFILRRVGLIQLGSGGIVIVGEGHAGDTLRLQRFLIRNGVPYRLLDTETDLDANTLIESLSVTSDQLPIVIALDRGLLRNPTTTELADSLGLTESLDVDRVYDVAVVGAGPSGLATAVYTASEGLDTIVVEGLAPGGQAATSSKIENYLGFPTGISGQMLAGRAQIQAQRFGARLVISRYAVGLGCASHPYHVRLDDGQNIKARVIVVATGAQYRKLDVPNYAFYEGRGIHYAATLMEARLCAKEDAIVIGGGNSAGQAATFLSRFAAHIHMLVRGNRLASTMSDYLIHRIHQSDRITLHTESEIVELGGVDRLQSVTWHCRSMKERVTKTARNVFVMAGAEPNTDWLCGRLQLDAKGFVVTGADVDHQQVLSVYATSQAGVFAIGDVRAGSVKRVAAGVGEGAAVVQAIHQFLSQTSE
jgi:thioredoxin reductase (NADPH)